MFILEQGLRYVVLDSVLTDSHVFTLCLGPYTDFHTGGATVHCWRLHDNLYVTFKFLGVWCLVGIYSISPHFIITTKFITPTCFVNRRQQ